LCRLWTATGNAVLQRWAEGLLDFVLWMYAGDGCWVNFIYDWEGTKNTAGLTSRPGINFWQARAMQAIAESSGVIDDGRGQAILGQAFRAAAAGSPPSDVRSIQALAALVSVARSADPRLSSWLALWWDEVAGCRRDGMLMNSPDERGRPHLWGHVQEAVLADASVALGKPHLRALAMTSATAVFGAAIESGFALPNVSGYDVQSAVLVMDRMAAVTGEQEFADLAKMARRWFDNRNPAGALVYDRTTGRVADGIDDGRVNHRSGAEACISAGLALLDDPKVLAMAREWKGGNW
jgi:hypothetical protein